MNRNRELDHRRHVAVRSPIGNTATYTRRPHAGPFDHRRLQRRRNFAAAPVSLLAERRPGRNRDGVSSIRLVELWADGHFTATVTVAMGRQTERCNSDRRQQHWKPSALSGNTASYDISRWRWQHWSWPLQRQR